jgi:hypothetical protein
MRRLLIAICAAAAVVLPASAAGAAQFDSTVKIRSDESGGPPEMRRNYYPHFKGTVRSGKDSCEGNRKVKLYRKQPGSDERVGGDRTNDRGKWEIVIVKPNVNDFYAIVEDREIGAGKCLKDRSPDFHHDPFD